MSILILNKFRKSYIDLKRPTTAKKDGKNVDIKNKSSDTMSKLTRDMDANMVKAVMNLNLTNNFKY